LVLCENKKKHQLNIFDCLTLGFIQYIVEPSFVVMGDMLEKILKSLSAPDSELPSPSIPGKSTTSSPSPPLSPKSSNESHHHDDRTDHSRERSKPSSMTTQIPRSNVVRRPWIEYLKQNRERWIREAGK